MAGVKKVLLIAVIMGLSCPLLAGNGNGGGNGSGGGNGGGGQGTGGGNGGVPPVNTGSLYGDLYVVLRDANGVPVLDEFGCVQPINAVTGEAFQLYTNEEEDVYCELTDAMAAYVQTVEFGRLNMGRSPNVVREQAFDEAIKAMNSASDISLDPAGRLVLTTGDVADTIDSPRENLALYIKLMTEGHWITTDTTPLSHGNMSSGDNGSSEGDGHSAEERPVLTDAAVLLLANLGFPRLGDATTTNQDLDANTLLLAASLLAGAADKQGTISVDQLIYINSIYGINDAGSLPGEVPEKTYFDFTGFVYDREIYRTRHDTSCGDGFAWTLMQQDDEGVFWRAICQDIMATVYGGEALVIDNVSGFAHAAEDALRMIEFIHDYEVPPPERRVIGLSPTYDSQNEKTQKCTP